MDPFLQGVAASLTASLVNQVGQSSIAAVRLLVQGEPEEKALRRVFENAFRHMLERVAAHLDQNLQRHVQGLLEDFLKRDMVSVILVQRAINLDELPTRELEDTFNALGFDSGTLPVSFKSLMQALLEGISVSLKEELSRKGSPLEAQVNHDRVHAILAESKRITKGLEEIGQDQSQLVQTSAVILGKVEELQASQDGRASDLWGKFEAAKRLMNRFNGTAAEGILDDLRQNQWAACRRELKAKVLGLLARIKELEGDIPGAIALHGQASDASPDNREKQVQQAHVFALQHKREEMFAVAKKLIEEAPNTPDGWNLWIQSAPDSMTFEKVESCVPDTVRDDADVLSCLSARARAENNWTKAETFARKAIEKAPDSPLACLYLGLTILKAHEGHLPEMVPSENMRNSLEEAEDLLTRGLRLAGDNPPKQVVVMLRANRALALRMLGRNGEALEELATLQSIQPEEAQVVLDYARLQASEGRMKDAARVLNEYLVNHISDMAATLLIEIYLNETPCNTGAAFHVADKALSEPIEDEFSRLVLLHHCIGAAHQVGNQEKAEKYLSKSNELSEVKSLGLTAEHKRLLGEYAQSQGVMRQTLRLIDSSTDRNMLRYIAHLLERGGLHREALDVWRSFAPSEFVTRDTFAFLQCAKKCESLSDILDTCRRLRKNGILILQIYEAELSVLHELNDFNDAIQLTQQYLEAPFSDAEKDYLRFQLSTLGVITGRMDICEHDVGKLPRVSTVSPEMGEALVKLLYELGQSTDAIDYAYEFHRRFPDRVESHRALVAGLFYHADFGPLALDKAEFGSAVKYETLRSSESDWIILEDSPEADASRGELGSSHPICRAVLGKTKGETFTLRRGQIQDVEARIVQITSKYVHRLQESMKALSHFFGSEGGLELVSLQGKKPDEVDLCPILKELDEHEQRVKEVVNKYEQLPLPLVVLAELLGQSVLTTVASLHAELDAKIYCCMGNPEELRQALRQLRSARAVVPDLTALSTLIISDSLTLLSAIDAPVFVSEGVLRELREELRHYDHLTGSKGSLGKFQGKYTFLQADRADQERWTERLAQAIAFVEQECELVGGSVALELSPTVQGRLVKVFQHSVIETLALARREGSVLWTDDWRLFAAANSEFGGQPRVWTQLISVDRLEKGRFLEPAEAKLSAVMLQLGYVNLQIHRRTVAYLLGQGNYTPSHPSICLLLKQLDIMSGNPEFVLKYAGLLLKEAWEGPIIDAQKSALTDAILTTLRTLPYGGLSIVALNSSLRGIFGVDVLNGSRCEKYLSAWISSHLI